MTKPSSGGTNVGLGHEKVPELMVQARALVVYDHFVFIIF